MSEPTLRLFVTFGLLALFVALEYGAPARKSVLSLERVGNHAALALLSAIGARLALGGGLASIAIYARGQGWGLFNAVSAPDWLAIIASFLMLDFAIWAQHLMLHRVPFLWRLHRVHHADTAMDVTTAFRFHPFEILASLGYKVLLVLVLGAPPEAVLVFELVLGAGALFTHANIAVPAWLERPLRWVLVTPSLHMIHHSPNPIETNSNYGFSTNIWDRLFGTYRATRLEPDDRIGLEAFRCPEDQTLPALLLNPLLPVSPTAKS